MTSYPLSDFSGFMTSAAVLYTQVSYEDVPLLHMAYAVMIHSWLLVVIGGTMDFGHGFDACCRGAEIRIRSGLGRLGF